MPKSRPRICLADLPHKVHLGPLPAARFAVRNPRDQVAMGCWFACSSRPAGRLEESGKHYEQRHTYLVDPANVRPIPGVVLCLTLPKPYDISSVQAKRFDAWKARLLLGKASESLIGIFDPALGEYWLCPV